MEEPGPSAWWHLASLLQLQGRLRATCQSASPPPKYFQEMVGGSGNGPGFCIYKSLHF